MTIGTLTVYVALDEPEKIYCGSDDAITGHVTVHYTPTSSKKQTSPPPDLFGPLHLTAHFHGRAKTRVYKNNSQNRQTYRGRSPLFSAISVVHDGPFRSAPNETHRFPFSVTFPSSIDISHTGAWKPDYCFDTAFTGDLPPSFDLRYTGLAHRFDALTEYRLGAQASLPGLDVYIDARHAGKNSPLHSSQELEIHYSPPLSRLPADPANSTFTNHHKIQNALLLPEPDRPSGFKEKFKSLTHSDYFPEFHFEVLCTHPRRLYLHSPLHFSIRVRPQADLCTAPLWPEVHLKIFTFTLTARTSARAEQQFLSEPSSEGSETILRFSASAKDLPPGPFEKANDMTKAIVTDVLAGGPCSFATRNIRRAYEMRIELVVACAGKSMRVRRDVEVVVCPPLAGQVQRVGSGEDGGDCVAGPSSLPSSAGKVGAADGKQAVLPRYEEREEPPAYGEHARAPVESRD
ncbi:hypothetical protein B0A50_05639 [Salinomyces thailandicus]|uniref:Arrestin-like N-terminal domain-containing protein n=1 Tax=Salinomyces thailandicus TaxID=706561 RepID=A0A4U0TUH4_9PEZI|nr:hypothetical protein B0A50_05639 [Salinomyces thailandica]